MSYIYDIMLNFNKNLIEYFEWNDNDNIKYIKKIKLFKINKKAMNDIIKNEVIIDKKFNEILKEDEINDLDKQTKVCLLTDESIAVGVLIKNNKIEYISRMLLDEEYEVLRLSNTMTITNIKYQIQKKRKISNTLTREELKIKKLLQEEIESLYKKSNINKLIYLYYEYTNKENKDIKYIYKFLLESLKNFNPKHEKLYKILTINKVETKITIKNLSKDLN